MDTKGFRIIVASNFYNTKRLCEIKGPLKWFGF